MLWTEGNLDTASNELQICRGRHDPPVSDTTLSQAQFVPNLRPVRMACSRPTREPLNKHWHISAEAVHDADARKALAQTALPWQIHTYASIVSELQGQKWTSASGQYQFTEVQNEVIAMRKIGLSSNPTTVESCQKQAFC